MKKRVVLFVVFFLVLTVGINGILAAEVSENEKVISAYNCFRDSVEAANCDSISVSEQIFALLSANECKPELLAQASENSDDEPECWPESRCDIKTTALSTLALAEKGDNVDASIEWLFNQRMVPDELAWYLEVDTDGPAQCSVTYKGKSYDVNVGENKILSSNNIGSCLSFGPDWSGDYWLKIDPDCYEEEFEVTCNESFLTTLLYHEIDSKTIHVMDHIWSRPADGISVEKIQSYCFAKSGSCDYGGSLWAAVILDYLGEDVSEYLPYLITTYKNHRSDFPEPFLYMLTGELQYKTAILEAQINEQYWKKGTDKYYDSALALLPFRSESLYEKDNAIDWLLEIQQDDSCWDGGNIVNNGFILYSIWPHLGPSAQDTTGGITNVSLDNDCDASGYYCMSSANCEGNILSDYDCAGLEICCSEESIDPTCSELSGEVCVGGQYCLGGNTAYASDLSYGESCCVGGTCEERITTEENTCVPNGGVCETFSCGSGYEESSTYTCDSGDTCCMQKTSSGKSYLWVWILFILVILIVIAIIYREKLKEIIVKIQHKGGKGPAPVQRRPGYPPAPGYNRNPTMPPMQRKILPPQPRPIQRPVKNPRELDDVLRKLKQMGK